MKKEQTTFPELRKDEMGIKWFEKLPPGTRKATIDDFRDGKGRWLLNFPYLIHSLIHPDRYYAYRTDVEFIYKNDFADFLQMGRVYVFENSLIS